MHLSLHCAARPIAVAIWIAVAAGSAAAIDAAATAASADLPVTLSQLVTGPQSHVRLTNTASQPVTAWAVSTITVGADGKTRGEIETVDAYLSEVTDGMPGSTPRLSRLMPGESREFALDPLPAGAKADVIAVVLDDGTGLGDQEVLRGVFERRAAERDSLNAIASIFDEVLANTRGPAAIEALRTRLQAVAQRDASVPVRAAVEAVERYAAQSTARTAEALHESLQAYAQVVKRQSELARKHAQRKAPSL